MRFPTVLLMLLGIGLFAFGCSSGTTRPEDAGTDAGIDAGIDGGDPGADPGGDQAPVTGTPRKSVTSGGGTTQSDNYKVRLHVGAPQPYGRAEGAGHKVQAGPKPNP